MLPFLAILAAAKTPAPTGPPPDRATVVSVYDGDTLTLDTGDRVRVSSVNCPELKPPEEFGPEAGALTRSLTEGKQVELIFTAENPRDVYGRAITGVRVGDTDVATALLSAGLCHLYVIPPVEMDLGGLIAAEAEARAARIGIWSLPKYQGPLHITSFHPDAAGNDMENVNGEYFRVANISGSSLDISRFAVKDAGNSAYLFPPVTLLPGHTVKVFSGKGEHRDDPAQQVEIYLNSDTPIWNNRYDHLQLLGPNKELIDERLHGTPPAPPGPSEQDTVAAPPPPPEPPV